MILNNNSDREFYFAVQSVLKNEGGFVDNKNDNGGATNFGISLRFYKMEVDKNATIETIKTLKEKDAIEIYRRCFWKRFKCDKIGGILGVKYFDASVNMGNYYATLCLQRALIANGYVVDDDGIMGEKTLTAISEAVNTNKKSLLSAYKSELAGYYRWIVAKNKTQEVFLKGWLKRAYM